MFKCTLYHVSFETVEFMFFSYGSTRIILHLLFCIFSIISGVAQSGIEKILFPVLQLYDCSLNMRYVYILCYTCLSQVFQDDTI